MQVIKLRSMLAGQALRRFRPQTLGQQCDGIYVENEEVWGICLPEVVGVDSVCVCEYEIVSYIMEIPYDGEFEMRVVVDYQNTVYEWDETNNEIWEPVPPTVVAGASWSLIRSLYR